MIKESLMFIGLGRIGLPQALVFAHKGFTVFGYDQDKTVVEQLKQGKTSFFEEKMDDYLNKTLGKTFHPIISDNEWDEALAQVNTIFLP